MYVTRQTHVCFALGGGFLLEIDSNWSHVIFYPEHSEVNISNKHTK